MEEVLTEEPAALAFSSLGVLQFSMQELREEGMRKDEQDGGPLPFPQRSSVGLPSPQEKPPELHTPGPAGERPRFL